MRVSVTGSTTAAVQGQKKPKGEKPMLFRGRGLAIALLLAAVATTTGLHGTKGNPMRWSPGKATTTSTTSMWGVLGVDAATCDTSSELLPQCQNSGTCSGTGEEARCICPSKFSGTLCQDPVESTKTATLSITVTPVPTDADASSTPSPDSSANPPHSSGAATTWLCASIMTGILATVLA